MLMVFGFFSVLIVTALFVSVNENGLSLTWMLVANWKTERTSELPISGFKLDF